MSKLRNLQKIATRLGYRGMKSFAEIYRGGTINTFGHPQNSMWTFTILLTTDDKVCGIEVHRTYFKATPQMELLAAFATFQNPKTIEEVLEYFNQNNIK